MVIGLILAYAGMTAAVPGCHHAGSAVVCDLDPPPPVRRPAPAVRATKPVVLASAPRVSITRPEAPKPPRVTIQAQPDTAPRPLRTVKLVTPPAKLALPPSGEEVQRRLASLVLIGDCTGARAYARSIGAAKLGDHAFTTCVGPQPAPKLSYALEITPRPPVIETQTNDAIIDQIPEMP